MAADTSLTTRVSNEEVARENADNSIVTAYEAADSSLTSRVSTEESIRDAADASIVTNLNAEISRATSVEADLDGRIDTLEATIMQDTEENEEVFTGLIGFGPYTLAENVQDGSKFLVKAFVNGVKVEVESVAGANVMLANPGYAIDANDEVVIFYQYEV